MAPAGKAAVCVSAKKAGGLASISAREKADPVSADEGERRNKSARVGLFVSERDSRRRTSRKETYKD